MAGRDPLHQQGSNEGGLEANKQPYNPPLLPYEKQLIELLGCTEDEFRALVRFNELKPRVRPAAYAGVPDIVNDPVVTPILINLAIGLALTGLALLLAPKPPELDQDQDRRRIRQRQLPDQVGPSRFNQTAGFSGYSNLVEYGVPVPIAFGRRGIGADNQPTGGLNLAGSLVWSRAFSDGIRQRAKLLYSFGEALPNPPQLQGVWLGTTPLGGFQSHDFCYYWSSKADGTSNRILAANKVAGTRGSPGTGDPQPFNEIFTAPVESGENGKGFSMAYNPQTKASFGVFNPVRNGTAYRLNWEVISIPQAIAEVPDGADDDAEDDAIEAVREKRALRVKNQGPRGSRTGFSRSEIGGQPGVGRSYGTKTGIISYKAVDEPAATFFDDKIDRQGVSVGDQLQFLIASGGASSLDEDNYGDVLEGNPNDYGIRHDDVSSATENYRVKVDQQMTAGSQWLIGNTVWIVQQRTPGIWDESRDIVVDMTCVEIKGSNVISFSGRRAAREVLGGYDGPWFEVVDGPRPPQINAEGFNTTKHCGAGFWNIVNYEEAVVRMIREADTIEFGIASTVWNQANGLCAFNNLFSPQSMVSQDKKDINLSTPSQSRYFTRTSCFEIWVRPIPTYSASSQPENAWSRIPQVFCVSGNTPNEMYNYLRVRPRTKGRYEFKISPRTGSDIIQNGLDTAIYWRLNAQTGETFGEDYLTAYGNMRITITGDKVTRSAILTCREMVNGAFSGARPPVNTTRPTAIANTAQAPNGTSSTQWIVNTYVTQVIGRNPSSAGEQGEGYFNFTKPRGSGTADDGKIRVKVTAVAGTGRGVLHYETFGTYVSWAAGSISYQVVPDTFTNDQWAVGDSFTHNLPVNNRYSQAVGYTSVSFTYNITNTETVVTDPGGDISDDARFFERFTQLADCSHWDEIQKSCDSSPEHRLSYVNECVEESQDYGPPDYEDLSMLGLSIKSSVGLSSIEQIRAWTPTGIKVDRLELGRIGASDLFSNLLYYLMTNQNQGAGVYIPEELIDKESFIETGKYLEQNKLFWNGVVESETNLRSFAVNNASTAMCLFTIKNGKYGLEPALPIDSSKAISASSISIKQIFATGNILEGSFKVAYQDVESRRPVKLSVRYRVARDFELPDVGAFVIGYSDQSTELIEDLDLSEFCDNKDQAIRIARYTLASKRYTEHAVSFDTLPTGLSIQPGDYIKVASEEIAYQTGLNVRIDDDLKIVSATPLEDGPYKANIYLPGADSIVEVDLEVIDGVVTNPELRGGLASLFTVTPHNNVYRIQEVSLNEEGIVSISAVIVPTDSSGASMIAQAVLNSTGFDVID